MNRTELQVEVTLFGETRTVTFYSYAHRSDALDSAQQVVVGRFPTGSKVHRSQLRLWRRNQNPARPLRGATAATIDGEEYVADTTLYTHNRNVGRIYGWYTEEIPEGAVARW